MDFTKYLFGEVLYIRGTMSEKIIRYIHGSEDSTDEDIIYVFDSLPSTVECKKFCDGQGYKNGNIIVIKNGVVKNAYKGAPDEVNNSLFRTYPLHKQEFDLLISGPVKRDIILKDIRVVRKILSSFTRTQYRKEIKEALRGGWNEKIALLKGLDYKSIDFNSIEKSSRVDILKSFAFQIGQALALHNGIELYTKREIADCFPPLAPYLKRQESTLDTMIEYIVRYATLLESIPTKSDGCAVYFGEPYNTKYDVNRETVIH